MVPSDRLIVPRSLVLARGPAVGEPLVVSGGHAVAHEPEHIDFVLVSGTHRYSDRPALSVRKVVPLLVRTSTVDADEPPPGPWDAGGAEGPWPAACDTGGGAGADAEVLEPLEVHAAAKTAAAASGKPTFTASGAAFAASRLDICCIFLPNWNTKCNANA